MVPVRAYPEGLQTGAYGILEPVEGAGIDREALCSSGLLWLIPGVAFDLRGNRLGRGGGYYDRLLAGAEGTRVGVAFEWQLVQEIPTAGHDVRVHGIVTEKRWLDCRENSRRGRQ